MPSTITLTGGIGYHRTPVVVSSSMIQTTTITSTLTIGPSTLTLLSDTMSQQIPFALILSVAAQRAQNQTQLDYVAQHQLIICRLEKAFRAADAVK